MDFFLLVQQIGYLIDSVGVLIIILGTIISTASFMANWRKTKTIEKPYNLYRQNVGRTILLSLEFLIAGDIVRSVVVTPSVQSVVILGLIVLVRTFLSIELEMKIKGQVPWWSRKK